MNQPYPKHNAGQPDEIDLDAIIAATRAEHAARSNADAWRITQRAIRRWTRRRHLKPAAMVATTPPPARTSCADADRISLSNKANANVHIVR
jgi:hypothetical protein